ncbi:Protein PIN-likeS 3 [Vitis vinifera]|uniref:Protein PIN-likeS 3 n=1 Tax=Vitis vinifera TaxID=29760 RepID=A0A438H310_VITVI|nr:Protein PIN-likeS 3 [Vitis vinifera]
MGLLDLFFVASMPVIKVLLVTAVGSFIALDRFDIFGENVRKQLNTIVFFVLNPALVCINLANTVTFESVVLLWFMPFNILITFVIGSALGWLLVKLTRAPQHLRGLVLGCCAAGNLGNLPLIIVPAVCREKGSPFGAPDVCHTYGMAYASLSMAIGAIYLWSYVYNIVRVSSVGTTEVINIEDDSPAKMREPLLDSKDCSISVDYADQLDASLHSVTTSDKVKRFLRMLSREINIQALLAPSTTGAILGFIIGMVPQLRKLLIGSTAPLRVLQDSTSMLGDAAIPALTLIMGGNLLKGSHGFDLIPSIHGDAMVVLSISGLKGSGIRASLLIGIIVVRYIFLPLLGIAIVKGAVQLGLVNPDPLYQFVLLLQYALPPAMNIGTITQLFGAGESECSVIMLWTYALASVALTLWSTLFMWLVA